MWRVANATANAIFDHISVPRPASIDGSSVKNCSLSQHIRLVIMSDINPYTKILRLTKIVVKIEVKVTHIIEIYLYINKIRF